MIWLVAALIVLQLLLWRRVRRVERRQVEALRNTTRFVTAQLDLDASNRKAITSIPTVVEAEVKRAIARAAAAESPRIKPRRN